MVSVPAPRPTLPRACLVALLAVLACARPATALPDAPPLRDADYLAFADRIVAGVNVDWDEARGMYVSPGNGSAVRMNANLLLVHAVAAQTGHDGPARQDARARALLGTLTRAPSSVLATHARTSDPTRSVCWTRDLGSQRRDHRSSDPQVTEALALAWRARRALDVPGTLAARVARAVDRCARQRTWRFPYGVANQFNWNAQLYADAAAVTGRRDLLRRDYRRYLRRFTGAIRRPARGLAAANLGPGYAFRYSPTQPAHAPLNFDTPEYANIVVSGLRWYAPAVRAGMRPLPAADLRLARAWITRLLAGAWTHAGYLNWDTGYGPGRWHSGQYWAFAQQGLLGIAVAPELWANPAYGSWAKALFDRGLLLYDRWAREADAPLAPRMTFGVFSEHLDYNLYATRMAANAMRAVAGGLGAMAAQDPPPLYAFDPDTERLAVTTPRYSTAIVPDNRGAFDYGGIDLARLYGPGQRVAATIGGEPPDAFGVLVRDAAGGEVLATQHARVRRGHLRILHSPHERARHPRPYAATPPAGPFTRLESRGRVQRGGLRIYTRHRFRRDRIDAAWRVTCSGRCGPWDVELDLPTWGAGATIDVVRTDGDRVRLAGPGADPAAVVALRDVRRIELGRRDGAGYTATPAGGTDRGVLAVTAGVRQRTAPDPGPTLALRLLDAATVRELELALRLVPGA